MVNGMARLFATSSTPTHYPGSFQVLASASICFSMSFNLSLPDYPLDQRWNDSVEKQYEFRSAGLNFVTV